MEPFHNMWYKLSKSFLNRFWFIVFSSYSPQCTTKDGSGWAIDVTEMIFHEKAPNKHKPIHAHTPTLSLSHTHPPTLTPSLTHTHKLLPALTHTNTNSPKSSYYAKRTNTPYTKVDVHPWIIFFYSLALMSNAPQSCLYFFPVSLSPSRFTFPFFKFISVLLFYLSF